MDKTWRYGVKTIDQVWMSGDLTEWDREKGVFKLKRVNGSYIILPICNVIYFTVEEIKDGEDK